MTSIRLLVAPLAFVTALAACGDDDDTNPDPDPDPDPVSNTIVDIAVEDGNFTTLVGALQATGLDETLAGEGPFTVFAPTDAAFDLLPDGVVAGLDTETLSTILTYHVVSGAVEAETVVALDSATTVEGTDVSIQVIDGTVIINGVVQVTTTDIIADNGVIHVIDSVLLPIDFPGDIVAAASAYPIFDSLVGAVATADLVTALQGDNNGDGLTVFAPINNAFAAVDTSGLSPAELGDILTYHVVPGTVDAEAVVGLSEATTLQGEDITISVEGDGVLLNGSTNVIQTDIRTTNGIIHVLDGVLLPPAP